ncbi:hypothetical protein Hanom_Chr02g00152521 [Helianthus anomalus]
MEEAVTNARATYEKMLAGPFLISCLFPKSVLIMLTLLSECDALKTREADLKARIEEMKGHHKAEIEELKLENADLAQKMEDLQATKAWLLTEGARLFGQEYP